MDIKRNVYLYKMISNANDGHVKVITGIRRCEKNISNIV